MQWPVKVMRHRIIAAGGRVELVVLFGKLSCQPYYQIILILLIGTDVANFY